MAVPTAPPAQETAAPAAAPALSDNLSERRFRSSHGGGPLRRARSAEDFLMASPDKIQNLNIVDSYLEASPDGDVYVVVVLDNTMVVDL